MVICPLFLLLLLSTHLSSQHLYLSPGKKVTFLFDLDPASLLAIETDISKTDDSKGDENSPSKLNLTFHHEKYLLQKKSLSYGNSNHVLKPRASGQHTVTFENTGSQKL
ncbi:MAG: hypothetical protein MHPSP_001714, partial [Paramarteilia canceri]